MPKFNAFLTLTLAHRCASITISLGSGKAGLPGFACVLELGCADPRNSAV